MPKTTHILNSNRGLKTRRADQLDCRAITGQLVGRYRLWYGHCGGGFWDIWRFANARQLIQPQNVRPSYTTHVINFYDHYSNKGRKKKSVIFKGGKRRGKRETPDRRRACSTLISGYPKDFVLYRRVGGDKKKGESTGLTEGHSTFTSGYPKNVTHRSLLTTVNEKIKRIRKRV